MNNYNMISLLCKFNMLYTCLNYLLHSRSNLNYLLHIRRCNIWITKIKIDQLIPIFQQRVDIQGLHQTYTRTSTVGRNEWISLSYNLSKNLIGGQNMWFSVILLDEDGSFVFFIGTLILDSRNHLLTYHFPHDLSCHPL